MDAGISGVVRSGSGAVSSLPPPCPRSPPEYPDLYGKRRESARVQMLEREIGFLEEELKSVEGLEPASRCCKDVVDFSLENSDPLIPTYRKRRRFCGGFWKWLWSGISAQTAHSQTAQTAHSQNVLAPRAAASASASAFQSGADPVAVAAAAAAAAVGFPGFLTPAAGAALGITVPAATVGGTVAAAIAAVSGVAALLGQNAPAIVDVLNVGVWSCRRILVRVSAVEAYAVLILVTIVIKFDVNLDNGNSEKT
ncbi:hypothetical protein MLD38_006202 [Melastoma candidum]|uniref:Uncharacterized protein n=1 Tax=Melastoma candidum TaxID=119954 RepID=A0ACB9RLI3_9MYRT|nr:hypothetical protein MLD38_006202 [Melastoma candidum]